MTRLSSPSALRNRGPIADVLMRVLPQAGVVLEIASGSGEHVAHFAERMPHLSFMPAEVGEESRASIAAHTEGLANVRPPLTLDVLQPWPLDHADAIVCINMIHASVPETVPALFSGAARILPSGGKLITYGAYKIGGEHTAPSNVEFDAWLKNERNPRWGVRDLEALIEEAGRVGIVLVERIAMPANNFILVWQKS
jgi:cyclopropane fatty-acyl-phospholipid synthase-like methyltransferase